MNPQKQSKKHAFPNEPAWPGDDPRDLDFACGLPSDEESTTSDEEPTLSDKESAQSDDEDLAAELRDIIAEEKAEEAIPP
jgi:hypothetical protein